MNKRTIFNYNIPYGILMCKLPSIVSEAYFSSMQNDFYSIKDNPGFILKLIYKIIWLIPMIFVKFFIWFVVFLISLIYPSVSYMPILRLPFLLLLTMYNITTIIVGMFANLFDLKALFELIGDTVEEARNEFLI